MRQIIILLLVITLTLSFVACQKDTTEPETTVAVKPAVTTPVANIKDVSVNIWTNTSNTVHDNKSYYYVVEVKSDDLYTDIQNSDVRYLKDGEYFRLEDVINGSQVTIFNPSADYGGKTESFVRIVSPEILDKNKIFVHVYGVEEFDSNKRWQSYEEYLANAGQQFSYMKPLEPQGVRMGTIVHSQPNGINENFITHDSAEFHVYYGKNIESASFVEGDTLWQEFELSAVDTVDLTELEDDPVYMSLAKLDDKGVKPYDDKNVEMTMKFEDGKAYVGITVKEENWEEYDRPDVIVIGAASLDEDGYVSQSDVFCLVIN